MNEPTPDQLGELVRSAWIDWAQDQENPKRSWFVPYDKLSENDKQADRQIGIILFNEGRNYERLCKDA